jgi:hypothetical protein
VYKKTYYDHNRGVRHIVAMPSSRHPFTACGVLQFDYNEDSKAHFFVPGLATCMACWAREILEWEIEARKDPSNALVVRFFKTAGLYDKQET